MGVIIGTFSIVIMMSLGIAMSQSYEKQLAEWGSLTKIEVNRYNYSYDESSGRGISQEKKLDDTLVETFLKMDHVRAVTPILNISAYLKSGKYQSNITVIGIDTSTIQYFDFPKVEQGEMLSSDSPTGLLFGYDSCHFYNPKSSSMRTSDENAVDLMND